MLANEDVDNLVDLAETYIQAGEYLIAIDFYTQLITIYPTHADLYLRRANAYSELYDFDHSIQDSRMAITHDPDNASPYWQLGGYLLSREQARSGSILASNNKACFGEIILNYRISLEKDPSSQAAWLNLLEIHLLMRYWDDAISYYGECKPYITSPCYLLIRAFLGCLAITLAGDSTDSKDEKPLHNLAIPIYRSNYRFGEVTALINNIDQFIDDRKITVKVNNIYQLFINHFCDNPKNYYLHS